MRFSCFEGIQPAFRMSLSCSVSVVVMREGATLASMYLSSGRGIGDDNYDEYNYE